MLDPLGLDHDVVDVYLDDLSDFVKALLHASLVRHPGVFEAKGHRHVALCAEWSDELGRELVGLLRPDLVIPRVHIEEAQGFAPCGQVDHLFDAWQGVQHFGTSLIQACIINAYVTSPFLLDKNGVCYPFRVEHFLDEPSCQKPGDLLADSLPLFIIK